MHRRRGRHQRRDARQTPPPLPPLRPQRRHSSHDAAALRTRDRPSTFHRPRRHPLPPGLLLAIRRRRPHHPHRVTARPRHALACQRLRPPRQPTSSSLRPSLYRLAIRRLPPAHRPARPSATRHTIRPPAQRHAPYHMCHPPRRPALHRAVAARVDFSYTRNLLGRVNIHHRMSSPTPLRIPFNAAECDPVSDPEPPVPTLPEPDPGVFHHEPNQNSTTS